MGENIQPSAGFSSGLAVLLNGGENSNTTSDKKKKKNKNRLISCCDDFGDQSLDRTLEHIFDIPCKTLSYVTSPIDVATVVSIIRNHFWKYHVNFNNAAGNGDGDGVSISYDGYGSSHTVVTIEESSICGDIQVVKPPSLLESTKMFSSARANACVWKGKWMYEVTLETAGIQQIGWTTLSCNFTDHKGVGDVDDSYAFDGKRVSKWNKKAEPYGQLWVVGDIIGCCIDLDHDQIAFYRNGAPLGIAFHDIRKMVPGLGYYPAISLSQGERCELNFGVRPFRYPIEGFLPIQPPPSCSYVVTHLLNCFSRLLDIEFNHVEKLRSLKRFFPFEKLFDAVARGICEELFTAIDLDAFGIEYVVWGPLSSFILKAFGLHPPHDYRTLDRILNVFLEFGGSVVMFEHLLDALSYFCKTASMILTECPYTGSYLYLALACHILKRKELLVIWWKSKYSEFMLEGFLSRKSPNKQDLHCLMPYVWWPGSSEDLSNEKSMALSSTALSEAVNVIEDKHRDLCRLVMQFIPPTSTSPPQLPGSVFRTLLQKLLLKSRGSDRSLPPLGVSSNSVLVSLFSVILHFLSEGFATGELKGCMSNSRSDVGFLHRGGQQSFPMSLFLKNDPQRIDIPRLGGSYSHLAKSFPSNVDQETEMIQWEEGCMDEEETRATHLRIQKPCCCSVYDDEFSKTFQSPVRLTTKASQDHCGAIAERSAHVAAECSNRSLNDVMGDKPSSSDRLESDYIYFPKQQMRMITSECNVSSVMLREEELLDAMLLLYHLGLASNFKQASFYMSHQTQAISLLEETDKQIRDRACGEQLKRLKEARSFYREEVMDCVRNNAWYRISLLSRWKQRGMYAACMWIVQLLLTLSNADPLFAYIPEFYLETMVDCFHVLRKSDPPFAPAAIFINHGLASFVTFVVSHFDDSRISSVELRDLLLQSISALVQYKEFLAAFENNEAAIKRMPKSLLSSFDNRSWIPVTTILLRLCMGSGSSKHGESSTSSAVFQRLVQKACMEDKELFLIFINRLFNTLSWAMTEFSVLIRELQEKCKVFEFQQRKCSVIFDHSCNLARLLEFFTREIPQVFLSGADTNLRRLMELIIFILNYVASEKDPEVFELSVRRHGQTQEKINKGMILAPVVGIIVNLLDANVESDCNEKNDVVGVFASMDCLDTLLCGFQYLLEYNWVGPLIGDVCPSKLRQLEQLSALLINRAADSRLSEDGESAVDAATTDLVCCICYTCDADARFLPCSHVSCYGCISRHLLNCKRCFFCNATVVEIVNK
ncbi:E3 ubiquitin-protein ligase RKP-like [Impatiens glandulifera]|uniref:E3 ubiquitin-protein ligase RKP-like n=1 Tax=Impatiens glandulifera TaxID=253017 RepID=UPI001FB04E3B|nr:E3 ubiquitin-protein ligase RKP-like [Impatiens glandulifera]